MMLPYSTPIIICVSLCSLHCCTGQHFLLNAQKNSVSYARMWCRFFHVLWYLALKWQVIRWNIEYCEHRAQIWAGVTNYPHKPAQGAQQLSTRCRVDTSRETSVVGGWEVDSQHSLLIVQYCRRCENNILPRNKKPHKLWSIYAVWSDQIPPI